MNEVRNLGNQLNGKHRIHPSEEINLEQGTNVDGISTNIKNDNVKDTGDDPITFEELLTLAGTHGRWKVLIFILCALGSFPNSMNTVSYQLLGATPDFWCRVDPLIEANWTDEQIISISMPKSKNPSKLMGCQMYDYNYTAAIHMGYEETVKNVDVIKKTDEVQLLDCPVRVFNLSQQEESVVTQWDLVCDRRALYSTTASVNQAGMFVGQIAYGYIIDVIGRRRSFLWSIILTLIVSGLTAASPTIEIYLFMRFLIQAVDSGFYMACFVLGMELCSVRERTHVGALFLIPWGFGYMLLPGICYMVQKWRWMQIAITIPASYLVMYYWVMPESPRWLILHRKFDEALDVLKKAAKFNKNPIPSDDVLLQKMKNIKFEESHMDECQESPRINLKSILKDYVYLLINRDMRGRIYLVFLMWFSASMIYYGVGLNATNISANVYLYIFLGGVMEVIAYIMLWLFLMNVGRKKTLTVLFMTSFIAISIVAVLMFTVPNVPPVVLMIFSLCGKLSSTATFHLVWLMTAELFPTKYRPMALGQGCFWGRIGSICSPYINDILGRSSTWAPSAVFSCMGLIAALAVTYLPETRSKTLSETNAVSK